MRAAGVYRACLGRLEGEGQAVGSLVTILPAATGVGPEGALGQELCCVLAQVFLAAA